GFGIVFIEAIAKGCDVLAGNADGSVDALLNGKIGTLVDPEDSDAIYNSLLKMIENPAGIELIAERQEVVKANFGFERYKANVAKGLGILA
ncbi:MAG: glycosyltransferase, partial [Pedobacter sp.]